MKPVTLNERTRVSLLQLYTESKAAAARYNMACSYALAALGFDPALENHLDLDTGVITPPEPPKQEQ